MLFREARIGDWNALVNLHARMDAEEKALSCVVIHPATPEFIKIKLLDSRTRFLVVEDLDKIVAFAYGTVDGSVLEVQNVFVVPSWRRNGVAREMLSRLFSETPAKRARAFVLKGNIYHSFWTSLGFVVTRELVNAFEMELDFADGSRSVRKAPGQRLRLVG
jgi:N-acetylglutamate synthase-like GNAT family acetyltransferase